MTFQCELDDLISKGKGYIRTGQISMYSRTLKEMAELFRGNNCTMDQLKILVLVFYIDLSGFSRASYIDCNVTERLIAVIRQERIDISELEHLFMEWIQPDMISQHAFSRKECWYLLRLCVEGKTEQAQYILSKT